MAELAIFEVDKNKTGASSLGIRYAARTMLRWAVMPRKWEGPMPTLDERVAYLEGRTEDLGGTVTEIRNDIRDLRTEIGTLRDDMNRRFEHVDRRFEHMDGRFTWVIGIQVASVVAVVAAILGR